MAEKDETDCLCWSKNREVDDKVIGEKLEAGNGPCGGCCSCASIGFNEKEKESFGSYINSPTLLHFFSNVFYLKNEPVDKPIFSLGHCL